MAGGHGAVGRVVRDRRQRRRRVGDRGGDDLARLLAIQAGRRRLAVEAVDVQVVDDVGDEVARVLGEVVAAVDVARDAEAEEHLLAEAVRRGDRRGVEVRDGDREPVAALLDGRARPGGQQRQQRVARAGRRRQRARRRERVDGGQRRVQRGARAREPLAHAVAQLARGEAGERDEQQLVQAGDALGDVARGERGDGVGLAGAGAGLQHRHALRQRAADVELPGGAHRSLTSSTASSRSHSRCA